MEVHRIGGISQEVAAKRIASGYVQALAPEMLEHVVLSDVLDREVFVCFVSCREWMLSGNVNVHVLRINRLLDASRFFS